MILIYCDDMYNEYCIITVGFFNPVSQNYGATLQMGGERLAALV
jgi:hypothetical protein